MIDIKRRKTWYINHREIDGKIERKCTTCGIWLEENETNFYLHNKSKPEKGFQSECKNCSILSSMKWVLKNPSKYTKSRRKYDNKPERKIIHKQFEDRRRAEGKHRDWSYTESGQKSLLKSREKRKPKQHIMTDQEWHECKKFFNFRCAYCGLPIEVHLHRRRDKIINMDFHKEHVVDDGKNDLANCVPSCQSCNSSKTEYSLNDWYNPNNPKYTYERYHQIYLWIRYEYKKYIQKKKPKQKYVRKIKI